MPHHLLRERSTGRSVRQEGMLFFHIEGESISTGSSNKDSTPVDCRIAFDGETTRLLEYRGSYIGNIRDDCVSDSRVFDPHAIPLRHARKRVPLSVWLQGKEAVLAHPFGASRDFERGRQLNLEYEGDELVGGLECAKLTLTSVRPNADGSTRVSGRRQFWLAKERNMLPVRAVAYHHYYSDDVLIEETVLSDLREIERGIWFPFAAKVLVNDELELLDHNRAVPLLERRIEVEQASLSPDHSVAFFRDVEFPAGNAVYKIVDGQIVEGWVQETPNE